MVLKIYNLIAIITDVGMWVTPPRIQMIDLRMFLELSTFKHQTDNAFRSTLKTEKRPILTTNRFSLQAGIKPPYNKINKNRNLFGF